MKTTTRNTARFAWMVAFGALVMTTGCSAMKKDAGAPMAVEKTATAMNPTPTPAGTPAAGMGAMTLTGAQEVPPNTSAASGKSMLNVGADMSVTGSVEVMGMTPTAAHIHEAAQGANGPVIVPFTKTGANTFAPPAGAKLTEAQYASYKAGKLYVNVHSAQFPGGEVRMQLMPK
jgi:CHRD domain